MDPKILPKGVQRHTRRRADNSIVFYYYWRETGERLPDPETEPEKFAQAVERCRLGLQPPLRPRRQGSRGAAGTLGALVIERQQNREYLMTTKASTRAMYDYDLTRLAARSADFLSLRVDEINRRAVRQLRDYYARTSPAYANRIVKTLSALFAFAIKQDYLLTVNPCHGIEALPGGSHTRWTDEQVSRALTKFPPYLARGVFLAVYTGQRSGDCAAMCWSQYDGRLISLTQEKTDTALALPVYIFPELKAELDRWLSEEKIRPLDPTQDRILRNSLGKPWGSVDSYQQSIAREIAKYPELDGMTLHGLRHTFVARAVERGATRDQIKAWTGHQSDRMVQLYMQGAKQIRMAEGLGQIAARPDEKWILGNGREIASKSLKDKA